ncbi:C39 family peptidase [Patescibacteria group bacterium]|nr:C39 family peptidase [Patescibacteria group bacterium]
MKIIIYILGLIASIFLANIFAVQAATWPAGLIVLQVQEHGEAYYIYPKDNRAYYLGRPADAFKIMTSLALGAKHEFIANTEVFPQRLSGMILLDVEKNGEAYYIYPKDRRKYYLGRPDDAFNIMRHLGLGISNHDLSYISKVQINLFDNQDMNNFKTVYIEGVPFFAQAPLGDWSDQRQAEGCEETSVLMAVKWARGQSLSADEATKEIIAISDYTLSKYGEFRDTSLEDTMNWIFKDYFKFDNVSLKRGVTFDEVVTELEKGNLVITAINGQMVNNPNYRSPGPPRHMLVLRGYDADAKQFITNDPGTSHGEDFRYDANMFFEAMRDYPTGFHEPIADIGKDIIVVSK